jgi:hypothetical protein
VSGEQNKLRGATGAQADHLRATVKSRPREGDLPTPKHVVPTAPAPPPALSVEAAADVQRWVDEGRTWLEKDARGAHALFEKAHRRNTNDTRAMSHYGLTLVLVEGDRQRGILFCEEAVRRGPPTTELLTNVARALVATRNKEQAVRALRRAQELAPDDPRVTQAFIELGLRRTLFIPWLPRGFFLNKWIGRLTWWLQRERRRHGEQQ